MVPYLTRIYSRKTGKALIRYKEAGGHVAVRSYLNIIKCLACSAAAGLAVLAVLRDLKAELGTVLHHFQRVTSFDVHAINPTWD